MTRELVFHPFENVEIDLVTLSADEIARTYHRNLRDGHRDKS